MPLPLFKACAHVLVLMALYYANLVAQSGTWKHYIHSNCPQEFIIVLKKTVYFLSLRVNDLTYMLLSGSRREMDLGSWYVGPFEKALENLLEQFCISTAKVKTPLRMANI